MATSTVLKLSLYGIVFFTSAVLIAGVNEASSDMLFEAAFQGECGEDSPCQHLCFDLHDGTFECGCREGFTLSDNGYSCSENSDINGNFTKDKKSKQNLTYSRSASGKRILPLPQPLPLVRDSDKRNNGNIRVLEGFDGGYEDEETTGHSKKKVGRYLQQEKYNTMDNNVKTIMESSRLKTFGEYPLESYVPNFDSYDETYDINDDESDEDLDDEEGDERYQYQPINTISVTTPSSKIKFRSCRDFECESGGVCVMNKKKQGARCRCPLGRRGFFCEYPTEVRYPRFKGTSYLTLPILRDAHKSMQITLEFRPETHDGILLYSGEKLDLSGDFIAVTLNRGFVEFRFDCGMGEGIVKSDQPVVLNSWNYLTVYRDRWDAWMQLNNGKQTQGRSKGLFSRITFRLSLFMGGSPNTTIIRDRLKMDRGFHGCVRLLEINKRLYDFRSGNRGDASDGLDIEECSADVCNRMSCRNGGHCVASSPDQGVCLCPLGFAGSLCETAVDIVVPSFNGSSYFQYSGLGNTVLSFLEVQIVFRPKEPNGLLFYNGYRMDGTGDFFSINLHNGFVELRFDLGTGPAIIRSPEPIEMDEWHNVFVSRTARDAILELNKQKRVEGISPGAFTQLSLPLNLYVGGVPDLHDVARKAEIKDYFTGCIQKVVVNNRPLKLVQDALSGINIANCEHPCVHSPCHNGGSCETRMDFYICHCLLGSAGTNCEKEVTEMIAEPMFNGFSYLQFVDEDIMKRIRGDKTDIRFRFRSFASEGLLLWAGERLIGPISDYLALSIRDGYLKLQFNLGSGEVSLLQNTTKVDDGRWHTVHIIRFEREGTLIVDNSPVATVASPGGLSQLNVNSGLFLGGLRDIGHQTVNRFHTGLVGCIANFTLSTDFHVRLVTQAATGVNIQPCV